MKLSLSLCAFIALGAACASDTDDRPFDFDYIHAAIIKPNCATSGCHSTLTQTADVDLQDRHSALLKFQENSSVPILELLKGTNRQKRRMPPDQPLPNADIKLIERWLVSITPDAGPPADAGSPDDAGLPDAGPSDAGPPAAGQLDN